MDVRKLELVKLPIPFVGSIRVVIVERFGGRVQVKEREVEQKWDKTDYSFHLWLVPRIQALR
jgi:hypothetical protein